MRIASQHEPVEKPADSYIVRSPAPGHSGRTLKTQGFPRPAKWNETTRDYDRFIDRGDRRKTAAVKRGKAAWSKLEDVLAEKRLQKELKDSYDDV